MSERERKLPYSGEIDQVCNLVGASRRLRQLCQKLRSDANLKRSGAWNFKSQPTLAAEMGIDERTIRRALKDHEALAGKGIELIEIQKRSRRGRPHSYMMRLKPDFLAFLKPDKLSRQTGQNDRSNRTNCPGKPDRLSANLNKEDLSLLSKPNSTQQEKSSQDLKGKGKAKARSPVNLLEAPYTKLWPLVEPFGSMPELDLVERSPEWLEAWHAFKVKVWERHKVQPDHRELSIRFDRAGKYGFFDGAGFDPESYKRNLVDLSDWLESQR